VAEIPKRPEEMLAVVARQRVPFEIGRFLNNPNPDTITGFAAEFSQPFLA
jgi:hypothetical protein